MYEYSASWRGSWAESRWRNKKNLKDTLTSCKRGLCLNEVTKLIFLVRIAIIQRLGIFRSRVCDGDDTSDWKTRTTNVVRNAGCARSTVGGIEYRTFYIFLFSDPYLAWKIWFEAPSLLPAKWKYQNSPTEGNYIEKCLICEHLIILSWKEKSSIFS